MGRGLPISIPNIVGGQGLKKNLEEKQQEKNRIYSYIGMEVYDLCLAGKLSIPQIDLYFEKMQAVEQEIADLEAKLTGTKQKIRFGSRCACGCYLKPGAKFCPQCGMPAETETQVCACGCKLGNGVRFCQNCGKKVPESGSRSVTEETGQSSGLIRTDPDEPSGQRECICGAVVLDGQTMCMECGRIVSES